MMSTLQTAAYWVSRPGVGELRDEHVPARTGVGRSLVQAEYSGVSSGTERLVGLGEVPAACAADMACSYMDGDFALPIKYGYCLLGTAISGALAGRRVFVMHPHQGIAEVCDEHATELPPDVPTRRGVLIPNLETALNAVWDAELGRGERVVVFGAGSVGLLLAYAVERVASVRPIVVDVDRSRLERARGLPWVGRAAPADEIPESEFTVAFHATGAPAGLQSALDAVGFEGRVIELSWFGNRPVTLALGGAFHAQRKRIIASQVAAVARPQRPRHDHASRLAEVMAMLRDTRLDALLGEPVEFGVMPELMERIYRREATHPFPLVRYASTTRAPAPR